MTFGLYEIHRVTQTQEQRHQSYGINLGPLPTAILALPFGIIATAIFLLGSDKFVYKFYREKKAVPVTYLIASVGIMFVLNGIVRFIIGPNDQRFADGERFIIKAKAMKQYLGTAEGVSIKVSQGLTVITAVIVVMALFWFLNKTRTGKSMRAFSDNEDLALLSGISPDKVVSVTWILVAILATIAGTLYGLDKSFKPFTYFMLLLPIFASAIVGGLGNPLGGYSRWICHSVFRDYDYLSIQKVCCLYCARRLEARWSSAVISNGL